MNFKGSSTLDRTAYFWLDEKKESGIEFCGPDTREWQTAQIIVGRCEAQISAEERFSDDPDIRLAEVEAIRRESYRKALTCAFKSVTGVTLNNEPVAKQNCEQLFKAFSAKQLIDAIEFLFTQESFLGKP